MANPAIDNNADAVLADYMRRSDAGETIDREAFVAAHPQVAEELREYFASVDEIERMAGPPLASTVQNGIKAAETHVSSVGDSVSDEPPRQTQSGDKPSSRSIPKSFGRYRIEKQLGRGAMGAVYLAHDTQLDRRVALKTPTFDASADADMVERFYREARAAANLRHAGICPIFDVGKIDGTHYISMAYIEGKPMSALIDVDKPLPIRSVVSLVRKIALALDHAHNQGVIHRDLKPANIMIDKQKQPLIMDFGLARRVDQHEQTRLTQDGMILGTPAYMSPEQVQGDLESGKQSDVYSLGVILYELLTGDLPFQGTVAAVIGQIMTQDAPPPSGERSEIDPALDAICQKMMARKIEDRFAGTKEAAEALTGYLKGKASGRRQPADPPPEADTSGSRMTVTAEEGLAEFLETASQDEFPAVKTRRDGTLTQLVAPWKKLPPRTKVIATSALVGLLLLLGVIIMIRTPKGMVRIEVLSDEDVEVLIDGTSIQLTDAKWQGEHKARKHNLGLKVGGVTIPFNAVSQRFDFDSGHFTVMVGDVEMKSERFDVASNGTTVLRIRFERDDKGPHPPPVKSDYDEMATGEWVAIAPETVMSTAAEDTRLRGKAIELRSRLMLPDVQERNMLFRCRIKPIEDPRVCTLFLRVNSPDTGKIDTCVSFWITDKQLAGIDSVHSGEKKHLVERRYSTNRAGEVELAFAAIDNELIGFVGGKRVCSAQSPHPSVSGIGRIQVVRGAVEISNMEYMPLRPLSNQGSGEKGKAGPVNPRTAGPAQPHLIAQFDHKANRTKESYIAILSPDATRVAYRMDFDDPLQMFETATKRQVELPEKLRNALAMDYNADSSRLATGHPDGTVRIWNSRTFELVGQPFVTTAGFRIDWVSLSDDGKSLLALPTAQPPKFYAWDVESRKPIVEPFALNDVEKAKGIHVASSADNLMLAIAYYEKEEGSKHFVQLWDVKTGRPRDTQFVPNEDSLKTIYDIDLSSRGDRLAVACKRGECFVFDTATGKQTLNTSHGGWRVFSARFSSDGRQLATCGGPAESEDMHLWDVATGEELVRWKLPRDAESSRTEKYGAQTTHLVWSRDGSQLLTAGVNTPVCVWNLGGNETTPVNAPPLANAPFNADQAKQHQEAWAKHLGLPVEKEVDLPGGAKMSFMLIPPGEFMMGSTADEQSRYTKIAKSQTSRALGRTESFVIATEGPRHLVRISQPFYLSKHETTQRQWQALMGSNPSKLKGNFNYPVTDVSWLDIQPLLAKLNETSQPPGMQFILPTEAQWEYACRAGTETPYYWGNDITRMGKFAWLYGSSGRRMHPIGQLQPNAFGIHDILGNVWEWCADWYKVDYYAKSPVDDPSGSPTGSHRVSRGGSYRRTGTSGRSAYRGNLAPDVSNEVTGFRLAMTIDAGKLKDSGPGGTVTPARKPPVPVTPPAVATSWTDLFNGKDLTGWQQMRTSGRQDDVHRPTTGDWVVQDGQIVCNSSDSGWLKSAGQFDNFELELEFKLSQLGNSGVYIRSSGSGRLSRTGVEVQVIDDTAAKFKLTSKNRSGAIHNVIGPSKSALRQLGEWNQMSIRCEGDLIQVTLNGVVTAKRNMADDSALRGRPRSGYLGLANWHGEGKGTAFRNIRVRELEKTAVTSNPGSPEPRTQIEKQLKTLEQAIFPWLVWVHAENDKRTPLAVATTSGLCCVYPGSFSEVEISSLDRKQKTTGTVGTRKPSPFCWIDPKAPRAGGIRLARGGAHRVAQPAVIVMQQDGEPQVQVGQVNADGTFTPEIPYNPPTRGVTAPGPIFNANGECLGYGVRSKRGSPIKIFPLER